MSSMAGGRHLRLSTHSRLARYGPVAAVLVAFAASVALMPRVDVPVGDDWVYAHTVERFLDGGGFRILDATVVTLALQALWARPSARCSASATSPSACPP